MRFRIAASLAAVAFVVILTLSLSLVFLLHEKEEEFIENQLSDQIEYSMSIWRKSPEAAFPNTPSMWLYRMGKGSVQGNARTDVPPVFSSLAVGNHEAFLGSKEYHVVVREDDTARYILAYDVEEHESRLDSLIWVTLAASLFLCLLTLVAGYWLAGRLSRRLERLAERVEHEVSGPLAESGMERELLAVANALDHYRARQAAALERERIFVANLSHELRTPLTGIRTDAEILAALPDVPEAVVRRGNRIVSSVDRINGLANSLLLLARETKPGLPEEVRLHPAIMSVWNSLNLLVPAPLGLRLDIPAGATVLTDPTLFDLVLRNVLENALRYSDAGDIRCHLNDSRLTVTDTGPGFSEGDLERVFDRFFVGERGGNGLGLALVRHICSANGWHVRARNAPGGGGEITLDFGASLIRH